MRTLRALLPNMAPKETQKVRAFVLPPVSLPTGSVASPRQVRSKHRIVVVCDRWSRYQWSGYQCSQVGGGDNTSANSVPLPPTDTGTEAAQVQTLHKSTKVWKSERL